MEWAGNFISFLAVGSSLTVLGWESMARGEDGADMVLVGCVGEGRWKDDVGVYGRVIGDHGVSAGGCHPRNSLPWGSV